MPPELLLTFAEQGGVASFEQIVAHIGRWQLHRLLELETLVKIWPAIYSLGQPNTVAKLNGLDLRCSETVIALQYEIVDYEGQCWRIDFAWPEHKFYVEYDGYEFHSSPEALRRDRQKRAALQEMRWRGKAIVADDVRRRPASMVRRIDAELTR